MLATSFFLDPAVTATVVKTAPHLDTIESGGKGMALFFWLFALVTVGGALFVITRKNLIAAVMGMVGSFVGIAAVYMMLYSSFLAVVQMLVYAGAIMVLFVFVVMMLNLGQAAIDQERRWLTPKIWAGPAVISAVLMFELVHALSPQTGPHPLGGQTIDARAVGIALFGPYLLVVELASMLLLAALVAAYHLGRHD